MKRILYAVMLLIGMSIMVSCEKEGGVGDNSNLEGKWWNTTKEEAIFNGKVVNTATGLNSDFWGKVLFENGNYTFESLNDKSTHVGSYSYLGDIINVEVIFSAYKFHIVKLSPKEGIADIFVKEYLLISLPDDLSKGNVVDTFEGKEIYYDSYAYWYYDNKGKPVQCLRGGQEGSGVDFWYDTERYYFRAE